MMISASKTIGKFQKDEKGTVAIIFGLTAIITTLITGLAIDGGRTYHASLTISSAMDSAALAAAKGIRLENLTDGQARAVAERFFEENMKNSASSYVVVNSIDVRIDRPKSAVEIEVDAHVPTLFGGIAGVEKISLPKSAVAIFDAKDIEVGLQLDVTGSMAGQKLSDLKAATKDLVDTLIPDQPTGQKVRIGYAPYSAGVNAGAYARAVDGNRAAPGNCVYERQNAASQATDVVPTGSNALKTRTDLSGSVQNCPSAVVLPLTDDKRVLKSTVDSYRDGGSTAGHLGTAWAWYLISPEWRTVWPNSSEPTAYNDGKTIKVAILMTDGEYNTVGGVMDDGRFGPVASQTAADTCAAMKSKGVTVYTVGFQLNVPRAISTLSGCASSSDHFYRVENGNDLRVAFRAIAEQIANLRLSK